MLFIQNFIWMWWYNIYSFTDWLLPNVMFLWFIYVVTGSEIHFFAVAAEWISLIKYTTICLSILSLMLNRLFPVWGIFSKNLLWTFLYRTFWKNVFISLRVTITIKTDCQTASHQQHMRVHFLLTSIWYCQPFLFLSS